MEGGEMSVGGRKELYRLHGNGVMHEGWTFM